MLNKKIIAGIFLGAGVLLLSACGSKTKTPNGEKTTGQKTQTPKTETVETAAPEKLPAATGKVDDSVDAIISGADSEQAQVLGDESEAASAVDDGQESNNLSNIYDQNEF